jgi:excisionase family DNA binding protein
MADDVRADPLVQDSLSAAEAASEIGLSSRSLRRLTAAGKIPSFRSPGGYIRALRKDLDAYAQRATSSRAPASSPLTQYWRESADEINARAAQKRAQFQLEDLEEQDRQRRDQREAERRAAEAQAQDAERRESERREEFDRKEEHQFWLNGLVDAAQRSPDIPPELAHRFSDAIEVEVEDALQGLGPDSPRSRVALAVRGAIARVIDPWMQEQQRKRPEQHHKRDIARAMSDATSCLHLPEIFGNRELQNEVNGAAQEAIVSLPESAMVYEQMVIAGRAAAQKVVRDHQQRKDNELAERQHKADVERYLLWNVRPYLEELQRATNGGFDFHGQIPELALEIAADIRKDLLAHNDLNASNARQHVRALVDRWLDANVKDEGE